MGFELETSGVRSDDSANGATPSNNLPPLFSRETESGLYENGIEIGRRFWVAAEIDLEEEPSIHQTEDPLRSNSEETVQRNRDLWNGSQEPVASI